MVNDQILVGLNPGRPGLHATRERLANHLLDRDDPHLSDYRMG